MSLQGIHVPLDADLSQLIRDSVAGSPHLDVKRHLGAMANAASPGHPQPLRRGGVTWIGGGSGSVQLPAGMVAAVADHLAALLRQARQDAHPAAGRLAALLAGQFGRAEEAGE